jgi:predicted AlkP superfamily phosphohydrolase/phosphomutase
MRSKRIRVSLLVLVSLGVGSIFLLQASLFPQKSANATGTTKRVLVLGFDGLDPQILKRLTQTGKLPHFKILMETSDFRALGTSVPPHMFWWTMDPQHPIYDPTSPYTRAIEDAYQSMATVLGQAMKKTDDRTTLIVMSDHGFAPFYRTFSLNQWLKEKAWREPIFFKGV